MEGERGGGRCEVGGDDDHVPSRGEFLASSLSLLSDQDLRRSFALDYVNLPLRTPHRDTPPSCSPLSSSCGKKAGERSTVV